MFEKNLKIGFLLDFYGELLTEKKREVMDLYFNNDMSLSEIAKEEGVSRQGIHDLVQKATDELLFYEEKLGLASRFEKTKVEVNQLLQMLKKENVSKEILEITEHLINTVEGT